MHRFAATLLVAFFSLPTASSAAILITEIMYDLEGSDTDREWVELWNSGGESVDLTGWKFDDGATSKHGLNEPPKNGGRGAMTISPGSYAVLAEDAARFISEHPEYSGTVIDTLVALGNTSDIAAIIDASGAVIDSVSYSSDLGAKGDGMSLQKSGSGLIAAAPTPGAAVLSGGPPSTSSTSTEATSASSTDSAVSVSSWPVEPRVFADAGADRSAVVGADALFEAKAYGLEKKPLENARFYWNFGDGATAEGARVFHAYRYPGTYIAVLDVASGYFSGSDRVRVSVEEARLAVRRIEKESGGFTEISNASPHEIDISLWSMEQGTTTWVVPARTFIVKGAAVAFPDGVTGMRAGVAVNLLYPNGTLAVSPSAARQTVSATPPSVSARSATGNLRAEASVTGEADKPSSQVASVGGGALPWANPWYLGLAGILASGLFGLWLVRKPPGLS